jgi:NAD(P)H-hydrate epimerase
VDALFGTGLDRPVEGYRGEVIDCINEAGCLTVALDIPSGIDADCGAVLGTAILADHTVTFAHHKTGMFTGPGVEHAGLIHRVGLGLPDAEILQAVGWVAEIIGADDALAWMARRGVDCHKYRAGSLLVLAGSPGKVGAALLAARGALRTGAGIVTIGTWPAAADSLDSAVAEVMTARIDPAELDGTLEEALRKRNAVAIGPGLGLGVDARALVDRIVLGFEGPAVVDADAISLFAGRPEALRTARGPRVLTPHSGELARLMGTTADAVEANRFDAALGAARATGQVVVLKGPNTLIAAPDGGCFVCTRGSSLLGTAGSGDVLTGMVGALLCVAPPLGAACAAVFVHATVADLWGADHGADRGMVAGDIVDGIPDAMASLDE